MTCMCRVWERVRLSLWMLLLLRLLLPLLVLELVALVRGNVMNSLQCQQTERRAEAAVVVVVVAAVLTVDDGDGAQLCACEIFLPQVPHGV